MTGKPKVQVAREHLTHEAGVLTRDLSDLHRTLNETRKGVIYEGDEPDLGESSIEDILVKVEEAVEVAEAAAS